MLDELTWTLTVYSAGFASPAAKANNGENNKIAIVILFKVPRFCRQKPIYKVRVVKHKTITTLLPMHVRSFAVLRSRHPNCHICGRL